jgi:hypothetical protein
MQTWIPAFAGTAETASIEKYFELNSSAGAASQHKMAVTPRQCLCFTFQSNETNIVPFSRTRIIAHRFGKDAV